MIHADLHEPKLDGRRFEAVTLSHSLEHMARPVDALRRCRELLTPGGVLGVAVPNWRSFAHRVLGSRWYGLDPPRHLVMYDRTTLCVALARAGFDPVRASTRSLRSNVNALGQTGGQPAITAPVQVLWSGACAVAQLISADAGGEVVAWAVPSAG